MPFYIFLVCVCMCGNTAQHILHCFQQHLVKTQWANPHWEMDYCAWFLTSSYTPYSKNSRAETECDGTRKRTGGEVKRKKANGGGSQQSCIVSDTVYPASLPLMRTPRLSAANWTDTPANINGLVRFTGKPNLVSARVPSRSVSALHSFRNWVCPILKWNGKQPPTNSSDCWTQFSVLCPYPSTGWWEHTLLQQLSSSFNKEQQSPDTRMSQSNILPS